MVELIMFLSSFKYLKDEISSYNIARVLALYKSY